MLRYILATFALISLYKDPGVKINKLNEWLKYTEMWTVLKQEKFLTLSHGGGGVFSTPTVVHSNAKTSLLFQHHSCELKAMKNGCNNMCHMLIFVKSNNNYF